MNNKKAADMSGATTRRRYVCQTLQTHTDAPLSAFALGMLWFSTEIRKSELDGGASEFGSGARSVMHCGKFHTR